MNIAVVGTGYVGLVSGTCLAETGNYVTCVDIDENNPIELESGYSFVSERGFRKSKNSNFTGKDIINLKKRKLKEIPREYLKEITTKAISICLEGKDLASRKIFKKIKQ